MSFTCNALSDNVHFLYTIDKNIRKWKIARIINIKKELYEQKSATKNRRQTQEKRRAGDPINEHKGQNFGQFRREAGIFRVE